MFKFRLEKLLRYRRRLEREKQREMFEAQTQLQALERLIVHLMEMARNHYMSLNSKSIQGISIEELQLYHTFFERLTLTRSQYEVEQGVLGQRLEQKRMELIEAQRDVKVLEKLQTRDKAAYDSEESRLERLFLDELGINSFNRRKSKVID